MTLYLVVFVVVTLFTDCDSVYEGRVSALLKSSLSTHEDSVRSRSRRDVSSCGLSSTDVLKVEPVRH